MRKWILGSMAAIAVLLAVPQPGYAGGPHGHGGRGWHGGGHWGYGGYYRGGRGYYRGYGYPAFGAGLVVGGLLGGWARPYPYVYRQPYVYAPQVVVQEPPPPIYVEQPQDDAAYWYYCQSPQGYYPYVQRCGSQWMQVVPPDGPPS